MFLLFQFNFLFYGFFGLKYFLNCINVDFDLFVCVCIFSMIVCVSYLYYLETVFVFCLFVFEVNLFIVEMFL